ncbi:hypothetical protein ACIRS1_05765 [Kitasatospora sp. NPDC101176]|uniref:hypothetical protein n=1 Tax=Kitasatospora sp. NPDC101176 TaxID=3364099 RepID=UPI00381351F6
MRTLAWRSASPRAPRRPASVVLLRARWLAPLIGELRPVLAEEGLDAVLRHTSERHTGTADSLVIVCELLGGDLESARRAIADHHGGEDDWRVRGLADAAERYAAQRATG